MLFSVTVLLFLANILPAILSESLGDREYTQELTVGNGGEFGEWEDAEFCPEGTYGIGYTIKFRAFHLFGDDTLLNGIKLICSDIEGDLFSETTITSGVGPDGDWKGMVTCGEKPGKVMFLSDFKLQVERVTGDGDETTANWVKFQCRDVFNQAIVEELNHDPGHGQFGDWGKWSPFCNNGTAICGLSTKVDMGSDDDTGLNDVKMYCCDVPEAEHPFTGTVDPDIIG